MTSLYENLPALEAAAQEAAPLLGRLLAHGEAAERAATTLLDEVDERRKEVDALERDVASALDALAEATSAGETRIEREVEEAAAACDGMRHEWRETEDETGRAAEAAAESVEQVGERMSAVGEEVAAEEDESAAAVGRLEEGLRAAEGDLQVAVASAVGAAQGLEAAVAAARAGVEGAADRLRAQLAELATLVDERMQATLAHIRTTCGNHVALIEQNNDALEMHLQTLAETVTARAIEDGEELRSEVGPTIEAFSSLRGAVEAASTAVGEEASAVSESYGTLTGKVGPLMAGVNAVREAASRVGVSWP
jgi:chromosome segregation ATPase